jgi:hypothetical protein
MRRRLTFTQWAGGRFQSALIPIPRLQSGRRGSQPRWNAKLEPLCPVPRCPGRLILDIGPIRERLDNDVPANAFAAGVDCGRVRDVVIEPEVATDVPA